MKKTIAVALAAILAAYAAASQGESLRAYEKGGYLEEDGDYSDKSNEPSNEHDASVGEESGTCGEIMKNRDSHDDYENDGSWNRNRHVGYSATASAAASADTSANTYEHGHKGNVYI